MASPFLWFQTVPGDYATAGGLARTDQIHYKTGVSALDTS